MPNTPDVWYLTVAPGSRKEEADFLFNTILKAPADKRVLVTTLPDPILEYKSGNLLTFTDEEINISKWWTLGLDFIASHYTEGDVWDVVLAESDVRISSEDVHTIRRVMREENSILAGADWKHLTDGESKVRRDNNEWKPLSRVPGFAFIVAGEAGIRHDPEFRWWLADDDFEWQSRVAGGSVLVTGTTLYHDGTQGPLTGDRLVAWEEDQIKFQEKWGAVPTEG